MKKEATERLLQQMLLLIQQNPGIRPRGLNRLLKLEHSASLRNTPIKGNKSSNG